MALRRKWSYEANVEIDGRSGTQSQLATALGYRAILVGPLDTFQYYANYARQESEGQVSADQFKAGADYSDLFTATTSWYVRDEAGFDRVNAIDFYDVAAGGLGYDFIKLKDETFTGRAGLSYRYDEYAPPAASLSSFGADFELEYMLRFGKSQLTDKITFVPAFEDLGNYIITHELAYTVPIDKSLWKLSMGVSNNYNSRPVAGVDKLDTLFFTRLVLAWGEGQPDRASRPVEPVAEVAESRQDVPALVESPVEDPDVHRGVRVTLRHCRDALGRRDDAHEARGHGPILLHHLDRLDGRAARGEHRVDDEHAAAREGRQLAVVVARDGRHVVALEADVADADVGKDVHERLHHRDARAQDRDDHDRLVGEDAAGHRLKGRLDRLRLGRQVVRRVDREHEGYLVGERPERGGLRRLVAQVRQDVVAEGMAEDAEHGGNQRRSRWTLCSRKFSNSRRSTFSLPRSPGMRGSQL